MTVDVATDLARDAVLITLLVSMPTMLVGMIIGLMVSLFQSVTSIQEQTLSFVPKILVTLMVVVVTMPWIIEQIVEYTLDLYLTIPLRM